MSNKLSRFVETKARSSRGTLPLCVMLFSSFYFSSFLAGAERELPLPAVQQSANDVTGTVTDSKGEPVIGASVRVQGSKQGTITDMNGVFKIKAAQGTKLTISFVGYEAQTVTVQGNSLKVNLTENQKMLDDVEVVAYGTQKKVSVTGAISSIKGDDLLKTPTGSVANVLAGMATGISQVQYGGEPGSDAATIFIRGKATFKDANPLIQVDGVERDMNTVDPNEIESVTILKDASATAVFGIRGANGVILITTKRGKEGKARISATTSFSVLMPTKMVEQASSLEYAEFYNQMQLNDHPEWTADQLKFSPQVLEKFRTNSDPLRFPNTNWVNYVMKDATLQSQHNLNISGGTKNVRYFVSMGAYTQGGLFKQFDLPYDLTYQYKRFNYRSNLDIDVTKTTTLSFNLAGSVDMANKPYSGQGSSGLIKNVYFATPFSSPGIVDGKLIALDQNNPDGINLPFIGGTGMAYYGNGFMKTNNNRLNADLVLNQKLDFITKGLSFHVKGSYNSSFTVLKNGHAGIASYTPVEYDGQLVFRKNGQDSDVKYDAIGTGKARNWYMEAGFNWSRSFGNHNLSALALYNQSKEYYPSSYSDIPRGYVGLVGRVTYDWKHRYMAEFNVGYNGSENYAPDRRFGTFPAGSAGWVISEEKFWEPLKPIVSFFKLRASVGLVGNDKGAGRFLYLADPFDSDGTTYIFGTSASNWGIPGAIENGKNNPNIGWEKALKQNYGVDINFLNDRLKVSVDYYKEHRTNIMVTDYTAPALIGFTMPVTNAGEVKSWGWELSVKWNDRIGSNFNYWAEVNLSNNENKVLEMKETPQANAYSLSKGYRIGSRAQYQFFRFYDAETPALYEQTFGSPFPTQLVPNLKDGDAVYVDLNKDGKIDGNDITHALGYTDDPRYTIGLNLGFTWKALTFSMQWTGAWDVSRMIQSVFRQPFVSAQSSENGGLLAYHLNHTWTTDNPSQDAEYPRATFENAAQNYDVDNTLYEKDAKYLRLRTVQLAYNLQFPFMRKLKMNSLQLSLSAYNLLTFTPYLWGDPESRASAAPTYPLSRTISLGLKVGF